MSNVVVLQRAVDRRQRHRRRQRHVERLLVGQSRNETSGSGFFPAHPGPGRIGLDPLERGAVGRDQVLAEVPLVLDDL